MVQNSRISAKCCARACEDVKLFFGKTTTFIDGTPAVPAHVQVKIRIRFVRNQMRISTLLPMHLVHNIYGPRLTTEAQNTCFMYKEIENDLTVH